MSERDRRRVIFNEVASDYDAIRPGYPKETIDEIFRLVDLPKSGKVLEVGCGSGQATRSLVDRGHRILALDISPALLAIASARFADFPDVRFQQISFEEFEGEEHAFDLIVAASSWHWVDPSVGYAKASSLLKPRGGLAVVATLPRRPFTGFFERVQEIYRDVVPEWGDPNDVRLPAGRMRDAESQIKESGFFREVIAFEHYWEQEYSADEYLRLLSTYSDHYLLGAERLERLLTRMGTIIDEEYGGKLLRPYVTVAYIGIT